MSSESYTWVADRVLELPRLNTVRLDKVGLHIGWSFHALYRAEERVSIDQFPACMAGDALGEYLQNEDIFDALMDEVSGGGEFVLYGKDKEVAFFVAYGYNEFKAPGVDFFFIKTVLGMEGLPFIACEENQSLFVVTKEDGVIAVNPEIRVTNTHTKKARLA